jgi:small conductance mechanosensitive channel
VTLDDARQFAMDYIVPIAIRIGIALVLFMFGRAIAKAVLRLIDRVLERNKADASLRRFVGEVAYFVLIGVVVLVALDTLGVKTTAVVAVLGAAGLAIGLALQGSLSNFAAGVMLILLRPYRVHDLVVLGKYVGRVEAIKVFHTLVITADHRSITIPNGQILSQPIENLTQLGKRRVDLVVTLGEVADLDAIKQQLAGIAAADPRVHAQPTPIADVAELTEAGAKLHLRAWTDAEIVQEVALAEMERVRAALKGSIAKFTVAVLPPV